MKNCIQTVVVTGSDPDELQENLNAWLLPLGKNVKNVQIIPLHNNSLVAVITYEANNPSLEMEEKIGALEADENHDPMDPIRALVMFESDYEKAYRMLEHYEQFMKNEPHRCGWHLDIYKKGQDGFFEDLRNILNRFNNDNANSQGD